MPRIHVRTNVFVSRKIQQQMLPKMQDVISSIPFEDGKYLMFDVQGECAMMFGKSQTEDPCMSIEVSIFSKVYDRISQDVIDQTLLRVTAIASEALSIAPERIFAFINPLPAWAAAGINIDGTVVKLDALGGSDS